MIFSIIFLIIFAVLGIIAFVREISYFLLRSKKDYNIIVLTPIKNDCDNAEYILRDAIAKIKWISHGVNNYVICLDCNMNSETKMICSKLSEKYKFVKIINKDELVNYIN